MTIIREPGTNLPKVPGTSLAGAARSYAAMRYGKPAAAGQHKKLDGKAKEKCPIIYTFGTATDTGGGRAGTVSLSDAMILFFPVHSNQGPIWISTVDILTSVGFAVSGPPPSDSGTATATLKASKGLSLGWLLLDAPDQATITPPKADLKDYARIAGRIVLLGPKLFSHIVSSNLEVRTSVSINPETGAAEEGALFTYEAIPRCTWLWCDIVQDDYRNTFPTTTKQFKDGAENAGEPLGESEQWTKPLDVVNAGLRLVEYLGVGGMGTRGFGRMRMVSNWPS
jgi:CRISPR-associated protein Cmr4